MSSTSSSSCACWWKCLIQFRTVVGSSFTFIWSSSANRTYLPCDFVLRSSRICACITTAIACGKREKGLFSVFQSRVHRKKHTHNNASWFGFEILCFLLLVCRLALLASTSQSVFPLALLTFCLFFLFPPLPTRNDFTAFRWNPVSGGGSMSNGSIWLW